MKPGDLIINEWLLSPHNNLQLVIASMKDHSIVYLIPLCRWIDAAFLKHAEET